MGNHRTTAIFQQVWLPSGNSVDSIFDGHLPREVYCHQTRSDVAVRQLVSHETTTSGRFWILIFPEGTRVPAGQKGQYRIGGALLAEQSGYPIIPVAHNAGEYWPRRSFIKKPGIIQLRIGKPIYSAGKSAQSILNDAAGWIEKQMSEITTMR
jgi:1-acyl-sn-glycerol-3-phosphate acyltransferase